ncbi:hypothetical protein [Paludisphaera borealis]|uniref:Outer membrane lipoprotein-sorting protein n=1 Tax=Paludisphaera borealis TaxID=1387353 RepID=A0A1U7CPD5_9BACT|nr:hypothetical protein [Paludisphaera borealis]APW60781.1 hypothetical protein BSF38_02270 [Paludisphaera borealis]
MALHLALLIVCLAPARFEAAPPPLPTIDEVLARLDRTEAAIDNLSVTTRYVKHDRSMMPGNKPVRVEMTTKFVVDREGRSWYDCEGEQVNFGPKKGEVRTYKGRWSMAFDGKVATSLTSGADGKPHFAEISDYPAWHGVNPLEFTTRYFQKTVTSTLRAKKGRVVEWKARQSRPVVVAETEVFTSKDGTEWKQRFWIDIERGVIVRRAALMMRTPEQGFREYTRIESDDHEEIAPGIWLPMRVLYESVDVPQDGGPEAMSWRFEGVNSDWVVNKKLPDGLFRLTFPEDLQVNDHRKPKPPTDAK